MFLNRWGRTWGWASFILGIELLSFVSSIGGAFSLHDILFPGSARSDIHFQGIIANHMALHMFHCLFDAIQHHFSLNPMIVTTYRPFPRLLLSSIFILLFVQYDFYLDQLFFMPPINVRASGTCPLKSAFEKSNPGCSYWNLSSIIFFFSCSCWSGSKLWWPLKTQPQFIPFWAFCISTTM